MIHMRQAPISQMQNGYENSTVLKLHPYRTVYIR